MKSQKYIILIIFINSLLFQTYAKDKTDVQTNKKKGWFDKLFNDWNKVKVKVYNSVNEELEFKASMKFLHYGQNRDQNPIGIGFKNFKQESDTDQSGFIDSVLKYQDTIQDGNLPSLDFRLVKDCYFAVEGGDWLGWSDYRLDYEVYAKERYYLDKDVYTNKKSTWKIKMALPGQSEDETKETKNIITKLCKTRSQIINQLKKQAEDYGDNYRGLYDNFQKRKISLAELAKVKGNHEQLVESVKAQTKEKELHLQQFITVQQQLLAAAIEKLKQTSAANLQAKQTAEAYNTQLDQIKLDLTNLESSVFNITGQIKETQQQLNEAILLQQNQQKQSQQIQSDKQDIITKGSTEKQEIEEKIKKLHEELLAKQQEQERQLKLNQQKSDELNKTINATNTNIQDLKKVLDIQQSQVTSLQKQAKATRLSVDEIQQKLNAQRTATDQLASKLKQEEDYKNLQQQTFSNLEQQHREEIDNLKKQLLANTQTLAGKTSGYNNLVKQIETASQEVDNAYSTFKNSLSSIDKIASAATVRTELALQNINNDSFKNHIQAIQSNQIQAIINSSRRHLRMQKERAKFVKLVKEQQRLSKISQESKQKNIKK